MIYLHRGWTLQRVHRNLHGLLHGEGLQIVLDHLARRAEHPKPLLLGAERRRPEQKVCNQGRFWHEKFQPQRAQSLTEEKIANKNYFVSTTGNSMKLGSSGEW